VLQLATVFCRHAIISKFFRGFHRRLMLLITYNLYQAEKLVLQLYIKTHNFIHESHKIIVACPHNTNNKVRFYVQPFLRYEPSKSRSFSSLLLIDIYREANWDKTTSVKIWLNCVKRTKIVRKKSLWVLGILSERGCCWTLYNELLHVYWWIGSSHT